MKLLREYIRELLNEDPMGFVRQLSKSKNYPEEFFGGTIPKEAGKDIKRAFADNADHTWLRTLDTVHWMFGPYEIKPLIGKGRDELSATMTLPGDNFEPASDLKYGLWIKGRITLATNNQDAMFSGFYDDYGPGREGSAEDVAHRDRSSGRNKRPSVSKDYSRYGQLVPGNEYHEQMARNIPYVLDQSTWQQPSPGQVNEALVDNWKPVGVIVADPEIAGIVSNLDYITSIEEAKEKLAGVIRQTVLAAFQLDAPIYNVKKDILWSPK